MPSLPTCQILQPGGKEEMLFQSIINRFAAADTAIIVPNGEAFPVFAA